MSDVALEALMVEAFTVAGAYSEDGYEGWVGMLRANMLRQSLNRLAEHLGGQPMTEADIERWIRADVERIKGLSPSQSEEFIRLGVRMAMVYEGDESDVESGGNHA